MPYIGSQSRAYLLPAVALLGLLVFFQASPVARAATLQSAGDTEGPYTIWWDWHITGNAIPGQTVHFSFYFYNTSPEGENVTLSSFSLMTPWATYTDPTLPQVIPTGYSYGNDIEITIPANQPIATVAGSLNFTGTYSDGTPFCSSTGGICTETENFPIIPDPVSLQAQVTTLNNTVTSLNGEISTLVGRITNLRGELAATNQAGIQDNATIASTKASLANAEANLNAAEANLTSTQSQLSAKESQLAASQSSVSAYQLYLLIVAAVPSAIAVLFAVLYVRNRRPKVPSWKP